MALERGRSHSGLCPSFSPAGPGHAEGHSASLATRTGNHCAPFKRSLRDNLTGGAAAGEEGSGRRRPGRRGGSAALFSVSGAAARLRSSRGSSGKEGREGCFCNWMGISDPGPIFWGRKMRKNG